jgi:hypothetical protein
MSETQFAMVSEWMPNGNIRDFVKSHRDANRFDLVSLPCSFLQPSLVFDDGTISVAGGRRKGLDLYA